MRQGETLLSRPLELRRYTQLPSLVYLLQEKKLTLLDPQTWDDSNDSHYIELYKHNKRYKSVLALCFTAVRETYHHWRVFAPGSGGVCIQFKGPMLIDAVSRPGVRAEPVRYLTLDESRATKLVREDLPFLKRYPYAEEKEFRFIFQSRTRDLSTLDFQIPMDCIERIILSPWLHSALARGVRSLIKTIDGCHHIRVHRTTLIGNEEWKRLGEGAVRANAGAVRSKVRHR